MSAGAAAVAPSPAIGAAVRTSLVGKAAEMATLVLLALVVPRVLGPADYGRFALALTLVTVGTLALTLGGPTVMARFVPAVAPQRRAGVARAITLRLARGRALALVALAAGGVGLTLAAPDQVPAGHAALVVVALVAGVGVTLVLQVGLGIGHPTPWSWRFAIQNGLTVAAALALHARFGATGAVAGITIAALLSLAIAVAWLGGRLRAAPRGATIPEGALRFGAWQAAAGALTQVAHRGAVVAVALAASPRQTGFAAVAVGVALAGTYAVVQAFTVALAGVTDGARDDAHAAEAALRRLAVIAVAATAPAAVGGAALSDTVVPAVFGMAYADAAPAFAIALALLPLAAVNALAVQVAALRLRPRTALWSAAAGLAAFASVAVTAVPAAGAEGGAAAAVAAAAAAAVTARALLGPLLGGGLTAAALAAAALTVAIPALT